MKSVPKLIAMLGSYRPMKTALTLTKINGQIGISNKKMMQPDMLSFLAFKQIRKIKLKSNSLNKLLEKPQKCIFKNTRMLKKAILDFTDLKCLSQ